MAAVSTKLDSVISYPASSAPVQAAPAEEEIGSARKVFTEEDLALDREDGLAQGSNVISFPDARGESRTAGDEIKKAVDALNKKMLGNNSEAIFGIHEETKRVTIKIVDKTTKEVKKEIPPEKTLDMIAKLWEMAGILVDEKR